MTPVLSHPCGLGESCRRDGRISDHPMPSVKHLRLVAKPPPRRPPPYMARISVMACNMLHGRSRNFALSREALERLIAAAEELERTGSALALRRRVVDGGRESVP
jgi:hypothetical protein